MSFVIESRMEDGRPFPSWYTDEPEMFPGDEFYMLAFQRLTTERQLGSGVGPIPHSAMVSYFTEAGLDAMMKAAAIRIITVMDHGYLDRIKKKTDRERESAKREAERKSANGRQVVRRGGMTNR